MRLRRSPSRNAPGQSTLFAEAFPARTSAPQGEAAGSPALAPACGTKCSASCATCDPLGSSLRTFLLSALAGLASWSLVWKRRDIPSCRLLWWVLGRSERRTGESDAGSWLTPKASDGREKGVGGVDQTKGLLLQAREWPTAHSMDNSSNPRRNGPTGNELGRAVTREWPNVMAGDMSGYNRGGAAGRVGPIRPNLAMAVRDWPTPDAGVTGPTDAANRQGSPSLAGLLDQESRSMSGKAPASHPRWHLNPAWVEELMGAPSGWTDLPAETVSALWETRTRRPSRS
jgi:hypothetical protein